MTYKMMLLKVIYHRLCDWIKVCTKTDLMIALHKFALLAYLALYMFDTNLVHIIPIDPKKMQISYMSLLCFAGFLFLLCVILLSICFV